MKSLHRAVDLLLAFQHQRELTVEELARTLGRPTSSVYRFSRVLRERGLLTYITDSKRYALGPLVYELGRAVGPDPREIALPILNRLTKETGETSFLRVRISWEAKYAACVESSESIRFTAPIGKQSPLYAGASAKVILAFMEEEERKRYLRSVRLKRLCTSTIVNKGQLENALSVIRSRGYDFSQEELYRGAWGLAAPIFNEEGAAIASLAITGVVFRPAEKKLPRFISLVRAAAEEVTEKLKRNQSEAMKARRTG